MLSMISAPRTSTRTDSSDHLPLAPLDALQEFFWATEVTNSRLALILARVEGLASAEDWRLAAEAVQRRYPLLSAKVKKIPGRHPYFAACPDPLQAEIRPVSEAVDIDALIAEALERNFGLGDGLLGRVTIIPEETGAVVIFTGHHAAFDGRTNIQIIEDLVAAASGQRLAPPFPLLPTKNELLGVAPPTASYETPLAGPGRASPPEVAHPGAKSATLKLSIEELAALRALARKKGATVHAALAVSCLMAGKQARAEWNERAVVCLSPIDLRPLLGLANVPAVLTTIHPTISLPGQASSFWDAAQALKLALNESATIQAARRGAEALKGFVAAERDPFDATTIDPKGVFDHDLMVSNYGQAQIRTDFENLRITALVPAHLSGASPATQTISAVTVNETLFVNHSSRDPIPGFLDRVRETLIDALREDA